MEVLIDISHARQASQFNIFGYSAVESERHVRVISGENK